MPETKERWEIATADYLSSPNKIKQLLDDGWEPYHSEYRRTWLGVDYQVVHFRRKVTK